YSKKNSNCWSKQFIQNYFPCFFFQFLSAIQSQGCGWYKFVDFYPHFAGPTNEERIRKPFFIIVKGHWGNRNLMFNRKTKSAVLKFIQQNRKIIRHATFGENTDA